MASKQSSPVSTLSSTIKRSHHRHHHHHHLNHSNVNPHSHKPPLSPDSIEEVRVTDETARILEPQKDREKKKSCKNSNNSSNNKSCSGHQFQQTSGQINKQSSSNRHRNVAIATQVISPSAIGGSLKIGRRRLCERYYLDADGDSEDQGLFPRRHRIPWGTLGCYAVSIGIVLLIMTGVVLAVGYMQSEKQRILSQQRFSQEYRSPPTSDFTVTTWRPKINWENVTNSPLINSSSEAVVGEESSVENATLLILHQSPPPTEQEHDDKNKKKEQQQQQDSEEETDNSEEVEDDDDGDDDNEDGDENEGNSRELEIYEPEQGEQEGKEESSSRKKEQQQIKARMDEINPLLPFTVLTRPASSVSRDVEQQRLRNNNADVEESHRSPSEVKVLPPKDFFTKGLSIEIPIYNDSSARNAGDDNPRNNQSSVLKSIINPASIPFQTIPSIGFPLDLNLSNPASLPDLNFSLSDPNGSAEVNLILPSQKFYTDSSTSSDSSSTNSDSSSFGSSGSTSSNFGSSGSTSSNFGSSGSTPSNIGPTDSSTSSFESQNQAKFDFGSSKSASTNAGSTNPGSLKFEITNFGSSKSTSEKPASSNFEITNFGTSRATPTNPASAASTNFGSTNSAENSFISLYPQEELDSSKFSNEVTNSYNSGTSSSTMLEQSPKIYELPALESNNKDSNHQQQSNLETDLFDNEFDSSSESQSDEDDDSDSTMSASNKIRGKPPSSLRPQDNAYTPRPGTSPFYPERPRVFSAKTSVVDFPMGEFSSNQSEVRVPPPDPTPKPKQSKQNFSASYTPAPADSSNKLTFNFNFTPDGLGKHENFNSQKTDYNSQKTDFTSQKMDFSSPKTDGKNDFQLNSQDFGLKNDFQFKFQPAESTTTAPLSTTEYQIVSPSLAPVTAAPTIVSPTSTFHFDFSQLTTPAPSSNNHNNNDFQFNNQQISQQQVPDVLSKRTFNFDFNSPQASATTNPFAHLLNSGVTSNIGSASAAGANLGYQNYNNNYNFDNFNTNYGPPANLNLPSGTIPLDLASSYIQAGSQFVPQRASSNGGGNPYGGYNNNQGSNNEFSYLNTNPPLDIASIIANSAASATASASANFPSVVTSRDNPNAPEYNTITQGIHLLSLLHGQIPPQYSDNQASGSNNYQSQALAKPEYQIAALTGYGGSSTPFINNLNSYNTPAQSRTLLTNGGGSNDYGKSGSGGDQQSSFSQNIATKLPDFSQVFSKKPQDSMASGSDMRAQLSAPNPDSFKNKLTIGPNEEREVSKLLNLQSASAGNGKSVDNNAKIPDMDTASSEIHAVLPKLPAGAAAIEKPVINFSKKLLSKSRTKEDSQERTEKGLKSGFYI